VVVSTTLLFPAVIRPSTNQNDFSHQPPTYLWILFSQPAHHGSADLSKVLSPPKKNTVQSSGIWVPSPSTIYNSQSVNIRESRGQLCYSQIRALVRRIFVSTFLLYLNITVLVFLFLPFVTPNQQHERSDGNSTIPRNSNKYIIHDQYIKHDMVYCATTV